MVAEASCNSLAITDLLLKHHPTIAKAIIQGCKSRNIEILIIKGASDYWCRDFMPIQINQSKFVQFDYDPIYYKHPKYRHLKTNLNNLSFYPGGTIIDCKIILDGGNVCCCKNKAILTDKLFKDNLGYNKNDLIHELVDLLELEEVVIIPALPYDSTGHSDGMIRFINEDTLLVNDFGLTCSKSYWNKLLKALKRFNLVLLPNDLHKNKTTDDSSGDYINMVIIKDLIFVPSYGKPTDHLAHQLIRSSLTGYSTIQVPSKDLSAKGGVLHCATWNYWNN